MPEALEGSGEGKRDASTSSATGEEERKLEERREETRREKMGREKMGREFYLNKSIFCLKPFPK